MKLKILYMFLICTIISFAQMRDSIVIIQSSVIENESTTYFPGQVIKQDTVIIKTLKVDTRNPKHAPNIPTLISPVNNAINQATSLTLGWDGTDPDGDVLKYDIYFGTNPSPPQIAVNQSNESYTVSSLSYNTSYYWKVVAKDSKFSTPSSIWKFTTMTAPVVTYSVIVQSAPNGSTVPTAGTYIYNSGSSVIFTATANSGYLFDHWSVNGVNYTSNPLTRTITSDLTVIPYFVTVPPVNYSITVQSGPNGYTIPSTGTYTRASGSSFTVTAMPNAGYQFYRWTVNGVVNTSNPFVTTVTSNLVIIPSFTVIPSVNYSVVVQSSPNGTTTPTAGTYTYISGSSVTFSATPNSGYQFSNWTVNGTTNTSNPMVQIVNSNLTVIPYFVVTPPPITGNRWYIKKGSTGDGKSWNTAWGSFNIPWTSIKPGDVIYISGGATSTVYYETLTPQCQGTAANRITIIAGKYAPDNVGHSGRVIIDGQAQARDNSIFFDDYAAGSPAYITVKGLELRGATGGIEFNIDDTTPPLCVGVIIDSLYIYDWYDLAGIFVLGNTDDLIIQNCRIVTFLNDGVQTDCFHFNGNDTQHARKTVIRNNVILNKNQDPLAHNDAIQSVIADGFIIYNNIIINDSVYSTEGGGLPFILGSIDYNYSKPIQQRNPVILYNNFCYMGGVWYPNGNMGYTMWTRYYSDQAHQPLTYVINNTIVTNGPRVAGVGQEYKIDLFINNIDAMYCLPDGTLGESWRTGGTHGWHTNFSSWSGWRTNMPMDSIRHNLFWKQDNVQTLFTGGYTYHTGGTGGVSNWSDWLSKGGTGVNADPLFVKKFGYEPNQSLLDGTIKVNSPAIDKGENIQPYLDFFYNTWGIVLPKTDLTGKLRDNTPSIGAYEY